MFWSPVPAAAGFACGVIGFFLLPRMPEVWMPATVVACGVLVASISAQRWPALRWVVGFAAVGFGWAYLDACRVACEPFPEALINQTLVVDGRIISLPESRGYAERFLFRVERLEVDGEPYAGAWKVRLSWYRDAPSLNAGERWRLSVRLKPAHGFQNPGGFDYERWLFQQGVAATGHIRDADDAVLLDAGPGSRWLDRWRQGLRDRLRDMLPDGPASALLRALVIGDRGGIEPAQWEVFSRTGTNHLIAISGLHVGLVAGVVFLGVRLAWARIGALARRVASPRAGALAGLAAAMGYAALAGFSISTQRASVMLAVVLLAVVAGRTLRPLSGLGVALLAVLLLDPGSVLSYGFWLSFGAVAVLLYALGGRLAAPVAPLRWGSAQWAVAVGLLPMLLLFFGRASLIAPAVNLVLVPLFGLVLPAVLLSAGVALISGWSAALAPVAWVLNSGYTLLAEIAALPIAGVGLGGRPSWAWVAAAAAVLLLLAPRGIPARWLGLVLLLPLAVARLPAPAHGEAELTMLDVGQGLSVVVRTRNHALVYDVGPRYPSGFNTGSVVVAPYLRHFDLPEIDLAIISHADLDHAGGLRGMLETIRVRRLLSGEPGELPELGSGLVPEQCRAGMAWDWDGVRFRMLHPGDPARYDGNNASCVLHIATEGASVLLTGDVERAAESELAATAAGSLPADVLFAPHHGSASSTTARFLRAVQPSWVWYSAGYGNRFGFPSPEVVERVEGLGIRSVNTATAGAVSLLLPARPGPLVPMRYRDRGAAIWRHRP